MANLKQDMHALIATHGHAAPLLELTACVGWQSRYAPLDHATRLARAVQLLTEAYDIVAALEAEEDAERAAAV